MRSRRKRIPAGWPLRELFKERKVSGGTPADRAEYWGRASTPESDDACVALADGWRVVMAAEKCRQRNDKPGSVEGVHFSGMLITQHLWQPTRRSANRTGSRQQSCRSFCLALLPMGFTQPAGHPGCWCALTAPFHPYHDAVMHGQVRS